MCWQLAGVAVCLRLVDSIGRRRTALLSIVATAVALVPLAVMFNLPASPASHFALLVAIMLYLFVYGCGMSTVPWIIKIGVSFAST